MISQLVMAELSNPSSFSSSPTNYCQLIVAYLVKEEYSNALEVCYRIPTAMKSSPPFNTIVPLVKASNNKQFDVFFRLCDMFVSALNKSASNDNFMNLFAIVIDRMRNNAITFVTNSYSVISCATLSSLLGLPAEQAVPFFMEKAKNCSVNITDGFLYLKKSKVITSKSTSSYQSDLSKLTSYVSFSEVN